MTDVVFLAAVIFFPLTLGLPVAVQPSLDRLSPVARAALAWAAGCLGLTMLLTLLSAVGIPWTLWSIALACIAAFSAASLRVRKTRVSAHPPRNTSGSGISYWLLCCALIAGCSLCLVALGFATSADLAYFWGAKAIHFAAAKGIDFELLRQPFMIHLHPNYPPLWPVLLGFGAMIAGSMPWLTVPLVTWLCLTAAAVFVHSALEIRLGAHPAGAVTCLWYAVLTAMTVTSFSGGNAEGYLVASLSVALVVILTEVADEPPRLRWLAAVFLAGAVFTKSEGLVISLLIVVGTAARDISWRRPAVLRQTIFLIAPAMATAAVWIGVRMARGVRLADPIREAAFHITFEHVGVILRVCTRMLATGAVTVGWIVPLIAVMVVARRRINRAIPAVITSLGVVGFAMTYYLHATTDPLELIVWTFPRLLLPATSAWILGGGVAVFSALEPRAAEAMITDGPDR